MGIKGKKGSGNRVKLTGWTAKRVELFLEVHGFLLSDIDGDDALWIGKGEDGKDAVAAFPIRQGQLATKTMSHSVIRQSGYAREHWELWHRLRKTDQKRRRCCE
jgi:hypothetical protein